MNAHARVRSTLTLAAICSVAALAAAACGPSFEDAAGMLRDHVRETELPLTRTCQLVEQTEAAALPADASVLRAELAWAVEDTSRDLLDAFADPQAYALDDESCPAAASLAAQLAASCEPDALAAAWQAAAPAPAACAAQLLALESALGECTGEGAWVPAVELFATLRNAGIPLQALVEDPAELVRRLDLSGPVLTAMIYFTNGLDALAQRVSAQLGPAAGIASLVVDEIVAAFVATAAEQILRELERHHLAQPAALARSACVAYRGREDYPRPTIALLRRIVLRVAPESDRQFAAATLCAANDAELGGLCEDIADATGASEALEREARVEHGLAEAQPAELASSWRDADSLADLETTLAGESPGWVDELFTDASEPVWALATPTPDPLRTRLRALDAAPADAGAATAPTTAVVPPSRGWALLQASRGCRTDCSLETLRDRTAALAFVFPRVSDAAGLDAWGQALVGARLDALAQNLRNGQLEILEAQQQLQASLDAQGRVLAALEHDLGTRVEHIERGVLSLAGCRDAILRTRQQRLAIARTLFEIPVDWTCPGNPAATPEVFVARAGVESSARIRSTALCTSEPFAIELAVEGLSSCKAPQPDASVADDVGRIIAALQTTLAADSTAPAFERIVFVGHTDDVPIAGRCEVPVPWSSTPLKVYDNDKLAQTRGQVFAHVLRERLVSTTDAALLERLGADGDVLSALAECGGSADEAACRARLRRVTVRIDAPALDYDLSCIE